MGDHPSAQTYSEERVGGFVGAKTFGLENGRSVIVVNGKWHKAEGGPSLQRLLAHEGGHVLLRQRDERFDNARSVVDTRAQWTMLCAAAVAWEEFRIERALCALGHWPNPSDFNATLFDLGLQLFDAVRLRYPNEPIERTHDTALAAAQQFLVSLAYRSAVASARQLRVQDVIDFDSHGRGFWSDYVGTSAATWQDHWEGRPDARDPIERNQYVQQLQDGAELYDPYLERLGFQLLETNGPEDYYFQVVPTVDWNLRAAQLHTAGPAFLDIEA